MNKFRLTIIREGENVWTSMVDADGFGILAVGLHVLNAMVGGGEIVLKPNRSIPKADLDFFKEMGMKDSGMTL